jgi:hypothetical protein
MQLMFVAAMIPSTLFIIQHFVKLSTVIRGMGCSGYPAQQREARAWCIASTAQGDGSGVYLGIFFTK